MLTFDSMVPALTVLAIGLAAGAWVALVLRRRAPVEPMRDALDDAEERLSRVMAHLRELSLQEARLEKQVYAGERAALETQAVAALRARDELAKRPAGRPEAVAGLPPAASPLARWLHERPVLRGALWTTGAFAVAGLLFFLVAKEQTPAAASGAQGGAEPARVDMPPFLPTLQPRSEEVQGLLQRLAASPADVPVMVRLGHLLLAARMYEETRVLTDRALQLDPLHAEALAHAAALRSVQDRAGALVALDAVLQGHSGLAEAWLIRGMIGMHAGDGALMQESFEKYLATAPAGPEREQVRALLKGTTAANAER